MSGAGLPEAAAAAEGAAGVPNYRSVWIEFYHAGTDGSSVGILNSHCKRA